MDNFGYLFAAYSLIFLLIGLYVWFVGRRQVRLESQLGTLEAELRDLEQSVAAPRQSNREM